ncbi:MFS transporter [Saccharibacillus sp. CPCC 101409]|uniref:MFS transporter n=1 Tax=Saccharibacillus sp. CPCC 101409 TaxID=3058041 RepID=UPI002671D569|nr:MFS transporter [Saccharibacillus sp. CPCC 101409]MDO3410812.1 MFS transporter [Saccharibacillus sp. CPCC 101409]
MDWLRRITAGIAEWPRNVKLFFAANLLYQIGGGMFSVLYNLYIQGIGYDDAMNGRVVSIQSLATACIFIPIGLFGDRLSRRMLLILGALLSGVAFALRALAEGQTALLALAVCSGVFAAFFQVLAIPFLAENVRKSQRLALFSAYSSLMLAAQVLGSMGGGVLADTLQHAGLGLVTSMRLTLIVGGAATFAAFVPMLFIREDQRQSEPPRTAPLGAKSGAEPSEPRSGGSRIIFWFVLAQLPIGLGSGLVVPYLNLYFTNRFGVSLTTMSLLISLGQIMTIVSMLIGPSLSRRVGPVRAVVIFQMLSLPFLLTTGFTNIALVASVTFLFRQALMNAANPIQSSIMIDRIPDNRRSIANSLTQTAFMLGWASMGPVQSYLVTTYGSYWGYAITFSITGALYVCASLLYYFKFREPKTAPGMGGAAAN